MGKRTPAKTHVMTIVHGQSEYRICCTVKSNLKIKHEIISRGKGKTSIQINGLMDILNDKRFRSFKNFISNFPDIEHDKSKLIDFLLFIIMDVDDCSLEMKKRYMSKELFANHWLRDYIIPIYNEPDLENTMKQAGITITKKKDYLLIFPTNHGDLDVKMAQDFLMKLEKCNCTNLNQYIEYCLKIANQKSK